MKQAALLAAAAVVLAACDGIPRATYSMVSEHMLPTLEKGDIIGGDRWKGECGKTRPEPGQIVFFRRQGVIYAARVIAGPGQTVAMKAGRLTIDGQPVKTELAGVYDITLPGGDVASQSVFRETLANGASYRTLDFGPDGMLDTVQPTRVEGGWFVLGDSRDNAADSRLHGAVPQADLCAVATAVIFAKDKTRVGQPLSDR